MAEDRDWNSKYLLDPFHENIQPSTKTGKSREQPARSQHQRRTSAPQPLPEEASRAGSYRKPPASAGSRERRLGQSSSDEPGTRSGPTGELRPRREGHDRHPRQRAVSLTSRFPGDRSHQPLDMIRREGKRAHRAPHLRRENMPGPDTIDRLDCVPIGSAYHHEGPYDAASIARNRSLKNSPLEAVRMTNEQALKATPLDKLKDSLERHRPLDGVAYLAPGMTDVSGRRMDYEEGANLMIEDGANYKRWEGLEYHPDDLKGKGEPSFSIERSLKQHRPTNNQRHNHRRLLSDPYAETGYEMTRTTRPSTASQMDGASSPESLAEDRNASGAADTDGNVRRRNTTGRVTQPNSPSLRNRFASFGRKT